LNATLLRIHRSSRELNANLTDVPQDNQPTVTTNPSHLLPALIAQEKALEAADMDEDLAGASANKVHFPSRWSDTPGPRPKVAMDRQRRRQQWIFYLNYPNFNQTSATNTFNQLLHTTS
jgi:hypothetical protein